MADTTLPALLDTGTHAARPAASAVGTGALYSCTDHGLVYQTDGSSWSTWATLGGDVSAHTGDTSDAHDASAISIADAGTYFTGTDVEAALQEIGAGTVGGSGSSVQQLYAYPQHADLTGDSDHFTADNTTKWTNQDTTFDTRDVVGGSFQRLGVTGNQTSTIRQDLGTTKAGAFDFRTLIIPDAQFHAGGDVFIDWKLLTSGGSLVASMRLDSYSNTGNLAINGWNLRVDAGAGAAGERVEAIPYGEAVTLRMLRDGSDNLSWYWALGNQPSILLQMQDTNRIPYSVSQTGTVARVEYTVVVPSGVNASAQRLVYIDYFQVAA